MKRLAGVEAVERRGHGAFPRERLRTNTWLGRMREHARAAPGATGPYGRGTDRTSRGAAQPIGADIVYSGRPRYTLWSRSRVGRRRIFGRPVWRQGTGRAEGAVAGSLIQEPGICADRSRNPHLPPFGPPRLRGFVVHARLRRGAPRDRPQRRG